MTVGQITISHTQWVGDGKSNLSREQQIGVMVRDTFEWMMNIHSDIVDALAEGRDIKLVIKTQVHRDGSPELSVVLEK